MGFAITKGQQEIKPLVLLSGTAGIGKTSLAAQRGTKTIIIDLDDGSSQINCDRIPSSAVPDWPTFLGLLSEFIRNLESKSGEFADYDNLVIDTIGRMEYLAIQHVLMLDGAKSLPEVGKGFGAGYELVLREFKEALSLIGRIRRHIFVTFTAHVKYDKFKNPDGADWDRYGLKLEKKTAEFCAESFDVIAFLREEVQSVKMDRNGQKVVGHSQGRMVELNGSPAWVAKSRYSSYHPQKAALPIPGSKDASDFWKMFSLSTDSLSYRVKAREADILELIPEDKRESVAKFIAEPNGDVEKMKSLLSRLYIYNTELRV